MTMFRHLTRLISSTTAQQGQRSGVHVQTSFKDLVPMAQRPDISKDALAMERPSEDEVQATADRTKAALERLVQGKIKAAQPKNVEQRGGDVSYMRYTPQNGGVEKQKIIKMVRLTPSLRITRRRSGVPSLSSLSFTRLGVDNPSYVLDHRWKWSRTRSSRPASRARKCPAVRPRRRLPSSGRRLARSRLRSRKSG